MVMRLQATVSFCTTRGWREAREWWAHVVQGQPESMGLKSVAQSFRFRSSWPQGTRALPNRWRERERERERDLSGCHYHNDCTLTTVDREIFACTNIRLLKFHVVLFSSPRHTGSAASFLLFDVEKNLIFVVVGYRQKFCNDENFPIYSILTASPKE